MDNIVSRYLIDFHWQTAYASDRFDPAAFAQSECGRHIKQLRSMYYTHIDQPMHPEILDYWRGYGVKKELIEGEMIQSPRGALSNHYSVFTPLEMEAGRTYPVVYCSHGGGQTAFDAEVYGFAHILAEQQFIYVCPNLTFGTDEFPRIIRELGENGYPIDLSRVYAVGFSGGSAATVRLAMSCPEMLAGVVSMPGPNSFNQIAGSELPAPYAENDKLRMPIACIGGTCDGGDRWPLLDETSFANFNLWMRDICKIHNYRPTSYEESLELIRGAGSTVERQFGVKVQKGFVNECEGYHVFIGDYMDRDGAVLARLYSAVGMPHDVIPSFAAQAWTFLKKFSRNTETGELVYERPAMDFRRRRNQPR